MRPSGGKTLLVARFLYVEKPPFHMLSRTTRDANCLEHKQSVSLTITKYCQSVGTTTEEMTQTRCTVHMYRSSRLTTRVRRYVLYACIMVIESTGDGLSLKLPSCQFFRNYLISWVRSLTVGTAVQEK